MKAGSDEAQTHFSEEQAYRHCDKKLARLLFDSGVIAHHYHHALLNSETKRYCLHRTHRG